MTIKINATEIVLRPSAVDGFYQCAYQWGKTFLEGMNTIPNSRAAIGTAIHSAAETLWSEAILTGSKDENLSKMTDAAMEAWKEEAAKGMSYGDGEDANTCAVEIVRGTEAFIEDIVPFTEIPVAVEERFTVNIDHKLVKSISGTVDYITKDTIADLKTSKRKPTPGNYTTQQSIYKYLAMENGVDVKFNLIQGVVLKKTPEGMILPMETDVDQAKDMVNIMLDTLDLVLLDVAPIETILRPNPKYYLCSQKYCALYGNCPATKGALK